MSTDLTSPLSQIIARAAARDVHGPAARLRKRMEGASDTLLVLVDCSASMYDSIGSGGLQGIMSKFDHATVALRDVVAHYPHVRVIAFGSMVREMPVKVPADIDTRKWGAVLGGSTRLDAALEHAARLKPRKTIIISDGLPDSESAAMAAVADVTGIVDCIYAGPDGHPAVAFLRSLARSAGGQQYTWEGQRELGAVVRLALPAPEVTP